MDGLLSPVGFGTPGAQQPDDTPRGMDGLLSPVGPGWGRGRGPNTNTNFGLPQGFFFYSSGTLKPRFGFRSARCMDCSRPSYRGAGKRRTPPTDFLFFSRFFYYAVRTT